ncbi:MAG: hypothetical protein U5L09_04850 [Bacteroidales bacterium]|nr:hypothetical protein [Bacteroidales bacterium]
MVFDNFFQILYKYIFKVCCSEQGCRAFWLSTKQLPRLFSPGFFSTQMLRGSLTACCDFRDKEIVRILLFRKKNESGLPAINAYISFSIFAGNTAY